MGAGDEGAPVWAEGYTRKVFEMMRENMGELKFAHQMLNIPREEAMSRFNEEDIVYFTADSDFSRLYVGGEMVRRSSLHTLMIIDPSTGEGEDESAIVVCGFNKDSAKAFVIDAWAERVLPGPLIDRIFEMYGRWKPAWVGIEEAGFQKSLKHFLMAEMARRGVSIPIRADIKPARINKKVRIIDGLQPFIARRQVYFRRDQRKLIQQLLDWMPERQDQRDDLVDALAYNVPFWTFAPRRALDSEIPYMDIENRDDEAPSYGLRCET
jgi:predicted phage terminase large subunit-like protein